MRAAAQAFVLLKQGVNCALALSFPSRDGIGGSNMSQPPALHAHALSMLKKAIHRLPKQ